MTLDELLQHGRIIPVITLRRVEDAVPLAEALVAGGVRLLEITLRSPAGLAGATAVIRAVPGAMVGIGTILSPDDLARAVGVGARFALSPGATPTLLEAAAAAPIPFLPGVATASELMRAMEYGFTTCKFFPASLSAVRAMAGPFPAARFCPTGGVTPNNAAEWLAEPNVVAIGGSWLTPAADVTAGHWGVIQARAAEATALLQNRSHRS